MRVVFDLDDTICVHKNRDYVNAKPIEETIKKMREMKSSGWEIIIYSARGQISCNGDLELIEKRNRAVVEKWLETHNVPYDKLIFGKPIADLYVDDKGISLSDFLGGEFGVISGGGSGKPIYRIGQYVKKTIGTEAETAEFKNWLSENHGEFPYPNVYSFVYNDVYMEYIDGQRACDVDATFTAGLIERCAYCRDNRGQEFDIAPHLDRLMQNLTDSDEANELLKNVYDYLSASRERLAKHGSFCHGDLILSNILVRDGNLYFIDARNTYGANSYLLDLAKLRMSLAGYERVFGIADFDNSAHLKELDEFTKRENLYSDVLALEIMFIFRCYRYKNTEDKKRLIRFALSEGELWRKR